MHATYVCVCACVSAVHEFINVINYKCCIILVQLVSVKFNKSLIKEKVNKIANSVYVIQSVVYTLLTHHTVNCLAC